MRNILPRHNAKFEIFCDWLGGGRRGRNGRGGGRGRSWGGDSVVESSERGIEVSMSVVR